MSVLRRVSTCWLLPLFLLLLGTASANAQSFQFNTIHSFSPSSSGGAFPGGVIQGSDGALYGVAGGGGSYGYGTVFRLALDGSFTTLHTFNGTTDGAFPSAGVIQGSDGALYGTASNGGSGYGTVFRLALDGSFTTLHNFNLSDGAGPSGGLIQGSDGALYGTTFVGGSLYQTGTVFRLALDGSSFTTLHRFTGVDGSYPIAGVIQGSDGALYGTTSQGGRYRSGTVFRLALDGSFTTLHTFNGTTDGSLPTAGVIQGSDGALYGTTFAYGSYGWGTVFRLALDLPLDGNFTTLHTFNGVDGYGPYGGVIQGSDGALYGTTYGTTYGNLGLGYGTVFRLALNLPLDSNFTTLHNFNLSDGASPLAGMIQGSFGVLYGTTVGLGNGSGGTVFSLSSTVSATPNRLWPPNHKMVLITVNYPDNCTANTCSLSVSSNQPTDGTGDGHTATDWQVVDAHHVYLRADRAGNIPTDRVYTIAITGTDANGNTAAATTTVTVSRNE